MDLWRVRGGMELCMLMWKVESGKMWVVTGKVWRGSIGGGWEWLERGDVEGSEGRRCEGGVWTREARRSGVERTGGGVGGGRGRGMNERDFESIYEDEHGVWRGEAEEGV